MEPPSLESSTSLELKDHLDCRMCSEWICDVLKSTNSNDQSRAPEIESHEYWKMKSQLACAESAASNGAA
jgi:hypothetical protein